MSRFDWSITREKIDEAVRQIVELANPLRVVVFGSWARGEHGPNSDVDIAVLLDEGSDREGSRFLRSKLAGIDMAMDILAIPMERFEHFRRSVNSVHYDIENEGVILYERGAHGSSSRGIAA